MGPMKHGERGLPRCLGALKRRDGARGLQSPQAKVPGVFQSHLPFSIQTETAENLQGPGLNCDSRPRAVKNYSPGLTTVFPVFVPYSKIDMLMTLECL